MEFSVNMKQMGRFNVTSDNVRWYENIIATNGKFFTLTPDVYRDLLCEFGIFYTAR